LLKIAAAAFFIFNILRKLINQRAAIFFSILKNTVAIYP